MRAITFTTLQASCIATKPVVCLLRCLGCVRAKIQVMGSAVRAAKCTDGDWWEERRPIVLGPMQCKVGEVCLAMRELQQTDEILEHECAPGSPHLADGASEISVSDPESYLARMDGMRFGRSVGRSHRSAASPPSPPSSSSSVVSG